MRDAILPPHLFKPLKSHSIVQSLTALDVLSTSYCPLRTVHCLLPTSYCSLPTAHFVLFTAYCPLRTVHYLLTTSYCPLPTAHCLLPTAPCPMSLAPYRFLHHARFLCHQRGRGGDRESIRWRCERPPLGVLPARVRGRPQRPQPGRGHGHALQRRQQVF